MDRRLAGDKLYSM